MLKQTEGSQAVAEAVALCRPEVICAYPITPQTHIVENLGQMVKKGDVENCEFINVESELAALSVAIGASAAGARAYTATASQGLLFMAEAVYNASGLGLPIVMTIGNRAIGAPINIWNDQQDSMSMRDAGWIQLYAETNQEAVDLHIQAVRLAEELSVPVMVCVDGFILTHAYERVDIPDQAQVDAFVPRYEPRQILDPADPVTIGAMVGPEAFTEVRYLAHYRQMQALWLIPELAEEFAEKFGRESGGLLHEYRSENAETIVVALGSVNGLKDMWSRCGDDGVRMRLGFDWGADLHLARVEIWERIDRIRGDLPEDIGDIVVSRSWGGGEEDQPILEGRLSSKRNLSESYDLLERKIIRPLERVPGVASVSLDGVNPREMRINLRPADMQRHNIDVREVSRICGRTPSCRGRHFGRGNARICARNGNWNRSPAAAWGDARFHRYG